MKKLLFVFSLFAGFQFSFSQTTNLEVTSSNPFIESQFEWAIDKALSYVKVGTPVIGYSAAMDTSQFCARDIAHMAEGAHMLGLTAENWEMMYAFAYGANRRVTTDYYWPRWHYKFDGSDLYDFGSCQWRCLPTTFDVMQSCYRQYMWTGNTEWINDAEMFTFYSNTHDYSKFMMYQDVNDNGVADETIQLATYWEQSPDNLIESADAITYQYLALQAYAKILEAKGQIAEAEIFYAKSSDLKTHFETNWYSDEDNCYIRGFDAEGNEKINWGRESTFLMPYSGVSDLGERTEKYLDFITQNIYTFGINIEATTYLAEIYYLHGRNSTGWHFLKGLMASMNDYPEVSYLIVNNTVQGLMGIRPDAPNNTFYTLPKLSYEVSWVQAAHVPVGNTDLTIRHDSTTLTTVTNNSGEDMTWVAQFYGEYNTITIDGIPAEITIDSFMGKTISYVSAAVAVGQTVIVGASNEADYGFKYLSDMQWVSNSNTAATKRDFNMNGNLLFMDETNSYEKGLGVISNTEIVYDISGLGYKSFITDIGIDDEVGDQGSVVFEVWLDGTAVFNSGLIYGSSPKQSMAINIEGANTLKLVVSDGGDGNSNDLADWGIAKLSNELLPILGLTYQSVSGGDENGIFDQGETLEVHLRVNNTGSTSTGELISTCTAIGENSNIITIDAPTVNIGTLATNEEAFFAHGITVDEDAPLAAQFQLRFVVSDGNTTVQTDKKFFITDMYLSDADYTYARFDYGTLVKDQSITNNPIKLNGVTYEKGLGVHANCEIKYDLGGSFLRFISDIGVQDQKAGSVAFEVWADGVKIYQSNVLTDDSATVALDLDVEGVEELELRVTDGGDGIGSDHANWAGALLSSFNGGVSLLEEQNKSNSEVLVFPNPFNKSVAFRFFNNNSETDTEIKIYSLLGKEVYRKESKFSLGYGTFVWDGRNNNGQHILEGIYFYTIKQNNTIQSTGKIIKNGLNK